MTEKRFAPIEYRADAGEVAGVAVRYGDEAKIPTHRGVFRERIAPGAFGDVSGLDVILNLMHQRTRPLARSGSGLHLADGKERMELRAELPNTTDGRDARELLARGVLRGLSVEMIVTADEVDPVARTREIRRADLKGVGLVDVAAYGDSEAVLKRFKEIEDRLAVDVTYEYDHDEVTASSGAVRKQRIKPGAFRRSIDDPEQEILLQLGRDPGKALASKKAGTLVLNDGSDSLRAAVSDAPQTAAWMDYQKQIQAGMVAGVVPLFRQAEGAPDGGYRDIPELGSTEGVLIREYTAATLYGLAIVLRQPKGAVSEVDIRRRATWLL